MVLTADQKADCQDSTNLEKGLANLHSLLKILFTRLSTQLDHSALEKFYMGSENSSELMNLSRVCGFRILQNSIDRRRTPFGQRG